MRPIGGGRESSDIMPDIVGNMGAGMPDIGGMMGGMDRGRPGMGSTLTETGRAIEPRPPCPRRLRALGGALRFRRRAH